MSEGPSLSGQQSNQVLATVAELAACQLPLAEGLRAAGSEATGRISRALLALATELEKGKTLEQLVTDENLRLPPHVRGMVAAAARTGQLGPALDELLEHQRSIRAMFWRIWGSLAYPATVLVLNFVVIGFLLCWVVPVFKRMFEEFELSLPIVTTAIVELSDATVWLVNGRGSSGLLVFLVAAVIFLFFAVTGRGGAGIQRVFLESMPIVGVLWQWSGAAAFLYLLGALLDKQVPLAEALRLAAEGTPKADLRQSGHWLAAQVAEGRSLAELVEISGCLPASSAPLLRWGERTNSLPEAMRTLSEMFVERVQMRLDWLRSVSPPLVYMFVGLTVASIVVSLFMPLVTLIQGLM